MTFIPPRSVDQFCREARAAAAQGDRSTALEMVTDLVHFTIASETSIAQVFSSRQLDALCQEIGQTEQRVEAFEPEQTVYLVTFLSRSGGHSRVLRDLIEADPGKRVTILVSNVLHDADETEVRDAFEDVGAEVEVAPHGMTLADVVTWLQRWLVMLRAERAYILQHHFDAAIPAAVQPALVSRLFYIHNCDHSLTLGVHILHATHVDLHGKGFHNCRDREGLAANVCWPLVVDCDAVRPFDDLGAGELRTCTSGGREKFGTSHLLERRPYLLTYPEMVSVILAERGGTHHHIGSLPPDMVGEIHHRLDAAGIDPARFLHVDFVPRLATYFIDQKIDLYVGSMPWGGGRALIEVMGTGLPTLVHSNYHSVVLTDQNEVYPGALTWRTFDELRERLRQFDAPTLKQHAARSRAFYEARHRPEVLRGAIAATLRGEVLPEPNRPAHHPDALQSFLDDRSAAIGQVRVSLSELEERNARSKELEEAFRFAEKLAIERLAEVEALFRRVEETDRALATATQLAVDRLAEIGALRAEFAR